MTSRTTIDRARQMALAVLTTAACLLPSYSSASGQMPPMDRATPKVGDKARDFTLQSLDGTTVQLSQEASRGPLVLVVLRGWPGYQCPFCTRQFGDYLANAAKFDEIGARVLFVYPGPGDGLEAHARGVHRGPGASVGLQDPARSRLHVHAGIRLAVGRSERDRLSLDVCDQEGRPGHVCANQPWARRQGHGRDGVEGSRGSMKGQIAMVTCRITRPARGETRKRERCRQPVEGRACARQRRAGHDGLVRSATRAVDLWNFRRVPRRSRPAGTPGRPDRRRADGESARAPVSGADHRASRSAGREAVGRTPRGDGTGNSCGVTSHAVNHRGRERIEEVQPDEVQPGLARHDTALVLRLAVWAEHRKIDPREAWMEAGAPDHVRDVEDAAIRQQRAARSARRPRAGRADTGSGRDPSASPG